MALDFGLLNTNAPAQIAGAYGRGQQEAQANQLAQLQMRQQTASTQGAEMNLTRLKQEHDALDKLMAEITANGGPSDPMQAADMMLKSGLPEYFKRGLDMKQSYAQLNNDRVAMGLPPLSSAAAPAPAVSSDRVSEPNAAPGVEIFKVNEQPAPINALAAQAQAPVEPDKNALMMQAKAKLLSPNVGVREAGKLEMQQLLSPKEPVYHNVVGVGLVDPRTRSVVMPSVEKPLAPPTSAAEYKLAQEDPKFMRFLQERAAAMRAPIQPVAPTITQIVDPTNPNQMISVDARRYQGGGVGSAGVIGVGGKEPGVGSMKPLTEGQTIKLRADVGKDYQNASTALSQIDDLLKSATAVKTSPGLSAATGFTGKYLPSFSEGAAAQAETRLANLRGKVTALGKATASMGGAIGSIATQEWKVLADQVAVLDETKGTKPLLEQIGLLEDQARRSAELIRDKYEKTRAEDFERFPQFRDLPISKSSAPATAAPNIDALLKKYP